MRILVWNNNDYQENTYFVCDEDGADGAMIDPGIGSMEFVEELLAEDLKPEKIINTHGHIDHISGNAPISERFSIPVWCHELEAPMLTDPALNFSAFAPPIIDGPAPDRLLKDGDTITFANREWKVLHTPGHSPGGICLYCESEKVIFTGDTVICKSVGRTDLPGGDWETLMNSIRTRLLDLPDEVDYYSGHGPKMRWGIGKKYNPFLIELLQAKDA